MCKEAEDQHPEVLHSQTLYNGFAYSCSDAEQWKSTLHELFQVDAFKEDIEHAFENRTDRHRGTLIVGSEGTVSLEVVGKQIRPLYTQLSDIRDAKVRECIEKIMALTARYFPGKKGGPSGPVPNQPVSDPYAVHASHNEGGGNAVELPEQPETVCEELPYGEQCDEGRRDSVTGLASTIATPREPLRDMENERATSGERKDTLDGGSREAGGAGNHALPLLGETEEGVRILEEQDEEIAEQPRNTEDEQVSSEKGVEGGQDRIPCLTATSSEREGRIRQPEKEEADSNTGSDAFAKEQQQEPSEEGLCTVSPNTLHTGVVRSNLCGQVRVLEGQNEALTGTIEALRAQLADAESRNGEDT
ncbi:MAG: hypothetical protein OXF02_07330, partial [Simkaniaceae bacterium]|nr:hypothetical protein [Simkaniaceae bacterium]